MSYEYFLATKIVRHQPIGFDYDCDNQKLFDWQRKVVDWATGRGRAAIFADCGMGKTAMQLAWADAVCRHADAPVLILAPLAVSQQTRREGEKFGYEVHVTRDGSDVSHGTNITNYEMLERFDTSEFAGVVLDESSILKSFMGKTKRYITDAFSQTPYRLSCTATPSPNDLMELANQAEFLGVMTFQECMAEFFLVDSATPGKYRLKGHAERDFWRWVASWAVAMSSPADIGYPADGYVLPNLVEHDVKVDVDLMDGSESGEFFREIETSATGYNHEKRRTLKDRCARVAQLIESGEATDGNASPVAVWCYLNDEADELKRLIPDAVEVRGSDNEAHKAQSALDFADGKIDVLISKPSIFGFGMNFQNCHTTIFCGLDYSYESYYQAVRRFYRFGQKHTVDVWRVIGKTEMNILETINRKASMHDAMGDSIVSAMRNADDGRERFFIGDHADDVTVPRWAVA